MKLQFFAEMIFCLGRRQRQSGRRWVRAGSRQLSASDAKFDYEYLIKYKVFHFPITIRPVGV